MMDNCDGLALSLSDLAEVSRVGFVVYEEQLPIIPGLEEMVGHEEAVEIVMSAGGDFELVFTVRSGGAGGGQEGVRADGDRRSGGGWDMDGDDGERRRIEPKGYEHKIGGCGKSSFIT